MRLGKNEVTLDEVYCVNCDTLMTWSDMFREWECPTCGATAYQDDTCGPDELCFESGEDDDSEYDGTPEGFAACGGDYPNCTSSCPLYDE